MRCYVLFPLGLYHAQHGAGAYLGSQDAARPVCSFVWPSCNSTWNRKRRFLPCCPRTMRSREIPERTWARSNHEVFYQQRRSKIFISPAENLRIETSRSVVQAAVVFRTARRYFFYLPELFFKNRRIGEEIRINFSVVIRISSWWKFFS